MSLNRMKWPVCLAMIVLATASVHAQVNLAVTITISGSVQNPNQTDTGTITTTPAPTKVSINTASILKSLATAEFAEGNWTSATFPTGAKLVNAFVPASPPDFQVVDKSGNLLVDVSDILTGTSAGFYGADVLTGKQSDDTGLSAPTLSDTQVFTIMYDDTGANVASPTQFALTGLATTSVADATPNATTGAYKETDSLKLTDGTGDGTATVSLKVGSSTTTTTLNPMTITGSASMSGSATLGD